MYFFLNKKIVPTHQLSFYFFSSFTPSLLPSSLSTSYLPPSSNPDETSPDSPPSPPTSSPLQTGCMPSVPSSSLLLPPSSPSLSSSPSSHPSPFRISLNTSVSIFPTHSSCTPSQVNLRGEIVMICWVEVITAVCYFSLFHLLSVFFTFIIFLYKLLFNTICLLIYVKNIFF